MSSIGLIETVSVDHPMNEGGLLDCDGRAVLISEYEELYGVLGDRYGATETTFNLPTLDPCDGLKYGIVYALISSAPMEPGEESFEDSDSTAYLVSLINKAKSFGQNVINRFTLENLSSGITQTGKTYNLTIYCQKVILFLSGGSLYAALQEINNLIADESQVKTDLNPFITNDRLKQYKEIIEEYLGI